MKRILLLLFSFVILFGTAAAQSKQAAIVAAAGPPVLLDEYGVNYAMTEKEYNDIAARVADMPSFVGIKRKPANLSSNALYGFNLTVQGKNLSWILDGSDEGGYVLYADLNANGDLTDDKPLTFEKRDGKLVAEWNTTFTETVEGRRRRYQYMFRLTLTEKVRSSQTEAQKALELRSFTARRGVVRIGGRAVAFELHGSNGHYNEDPNDLYFDLNGDGKFDTETRYSPENFKVKERFVNLGDKTYEFTVDRFGERLTLRPLPKRMPDRADLREGTAAPDFAFQDLDGQPHRLSNFRGKVVLIDVWGLWCAPCVAEAPRMSGVYGRLRDKGFEIVSLAKGDTVEDLKKFIAKNNMNWTHGRTDEAFLSLYRVNGFPTYFLLDRDGRIVSNNLRPGDELYAKIEETLNR